MARAGLGRDWECVFANDNDAEKAAAYELNWGPGTLRLGDIEKVGIEEIPREIDLAWASFPCQDLSLAGNQAGLRASRSGTFWPFWRLISASASARSAPKIVALENVCGAISSHGGADFQAICGALSKTGYRFGAIVIDAVRFVPQSRPRLFIIAVHEDAPIPSEITSHGPNAEITPGSLEAAHNRLPSAIRAQWVWWNVPLPHSAKRTLSAIVEGAPQGVAWNESAATAKLLEMMSPANRRKVAQAASFRARIYGTIYKRTRPDQTGKRRQHAEVRFDGIAGCLRTPTGGSSRQTLIEVTGHAIRTRLLSPREAARLMGLPDSYRLPAKYNAAYHLAGDGVVVPVVRHLARNIFEPLIEAARAERTDAA